MNRNFCLQSEKQGFHGSGKSRGIYVWSFLLKVGGKSGNFIIRLTQDFMLIYVLNVSSRFTPN